MFGLKTKKDKRIEKLENQLSSMYLKHPHIITTQGNVITLGATQILEDGMPTDYAKQMVARKLVDEGVKQEPCEDCISRQDALDCCLTASGLKKFDFILDARDKIRNLPPVRPQEPETGHWIFKNEEDKACRIYTCDKCGEQISIFDDTIKSPQEGHYNHCPNCGQRKIELQESEGKE